MRIKCPNEPRKFFSNIHPDVDEAFGASVTRERHSELYLIALGVVLYCGGALILWVMPAYLDAVGRKLDLSSAQLGTLSAVELWATALASFTGPFWMYRFERRKLVQVAALVSLLGQMVTFATTDFRALLMVRAITGAFGEGLLLSVAYLVLGRALNVERAIGLAYASSILLGTFSLFVSPYLDAYLNGNSVVGIIWVTALAALISTFLLPVKRWQAVAEHQAGTSPELSSIIPSAAALLVLFGLAVWFAGPGGFWAFCEQLAAEKGSSPTQIGQAMAASMGASLAGSSLAAVLTDRLGQALPTVISTVAIGVAVVFFSVAGSGTATLMPLILFNLAWNFGGVYLGSGLLWLPPVMQEVF
jgi:predicted MFS family arabinose efflux permease